MKLQKLSSLCVFIGEKGAGKSTLFHLFSFLQTAHARNATAALRQLGGAQGIENVRTRDTNAPIAIRLQFREAQGRPLVTYELSLTERNGKAVIEREVLRRRLNGRSCKLLDFTRGRGAAITNESALQSAPNAAMAEEKGFFSLKSPDLPALAALSLFTDFPTAGKVSAAIENWHFCDARLGQEPNAREHPSLICVETPEDHLCRERRRELAERFRLCSGKRSQVFISTHSPDLPDALKPEEVFLIWKKDGHSTITCLGDDSQICRFCEAGEQLGQLWKAGFLDDVPS